MTDSFIEFGECGNYRGALQLKVEGGKFFWCVSCDIDESQWAEIPKYVWIVLSGYHADTAATRNRKPPDPELKTWDGQ